MEDKKNIVRSTVLQSQHLVLSVPLIQAVGIVEAGLISLLCGLDSHFETEDGWFFAKADYLQSKLGIGRKPMEQAVADLISRGLMQTKVQGMPCKKYYSICYEELYNLISGVQTRMSPLDDNLGENDFRGTNKNVPNGQTRMSQTDKLYNR